MWPSFSTEPTLWSYQCLKQTKIYFGLHLEGDLFKVDRAQTCRMALTVYLNQQA